MKFGSSVVIGKFYPPHAGHHFLIRTALEQSEKVTVIVCHRPAYDIPGDVRTAWIREIHPEAEVMCINDIYDDEDSELWARLTIGWLGAAPDAVFTSEDYGDRYAPLMGAVHVKVDQARTMVPCSGTKVRHSPLDMWDFLEPPVRAWYCKRVCVLGAESTGTTTLSQDLAAALQTCWVPEYGREYSELKQQRGETEWRTEEFVEIAREQNRREDEAARRAHKILVCDTNSFATCLWHRRYMGFESPEVAKIAASGHWDLYLLTGEEIPFVQDGLRDGEHIRHRMHEWFVEALQSQGVPWKLLRGSREQRLQEALILIKESFLH